MPEGIILQAGVDEDYLFRGIINGVNRAQSALPALKVNVDSSPLGRISADLREFDKSLAASNARVVAFGATTGILYGMISAFNNLVRTTIDVEKRLTSINVLINGSTAQFGQLRESIARIAASTGQTFDEVASAAEDFARKGANVAQTLERTNAAMLLVRTTGIQLRSAVEDVTSVINAFSNEALSATEAVNKLVNVGNSFSIGGAQLTESINRSAAAAREAGVSFDQLVALITSVQQETGRGAGVISQALRQIFQRVEKSSTLDALDSIGVAVRNAQGQTLPLITILQNLSSSYKTLGDSQRSQVIELVAGLRQGDIARSLFRDLANSTSNYSAALQASVSSTDAAVRKNDELNTSLSSLINKAKTSGEALTSAVGGRAIEPALKSLFGGINDIFEKINGLRGGNGNGIGATLGKGILDGISDILKGPGFILISAVFLSLFGKVAKDAATTIGSLTGLNKASKDQEGIQAGINRLLAQGNEEYRKRFGAARTVEQQEKVILDLIREENNLLQLRQGLLSGVGVSLLGKGITPSGSRVAGGRAFGGNIPEAAQGFVPSVEKEASDVRRGVGGASSNAEPVVIPNFNFGRGKTGSIVANTSEYLVKNFAGGSGTAVFNPSMVNNLGGFSNLQRFGRVEKVVPNFAFGFNKLPLENVPLDIDPEEVRRAYHNYARAYLRTSQQYGGGEKSMPIELNMFADRMVNELVHFKHKDSYILGRPVENIFLPTHFAPNSLKEGYGSIKALGEYDNVAALVTDSLTKQMNKAGFSTLKSGVGIPFRGTTVQKDLLVSSMIKTPLLASKLLPLLSDKSKMQGLMQSSRFDSQNRDIRFSGGDYYNRTNYLKEHGLLEGLAEGLIPNFALGFSDVSTKFPNASVEYSGFLNKVLTSPSAFGIRGTLLNIYRDKDPEAVRMVEYIASHPEAERYTKSNIRTIRNSLPSTVSYSGQYAQASDILGQIDPRKNPLVFRRGRSAIEEAFSNAKFAQVQITNSGLRERLGEILEKKTTPLIAEFQRRGVNLLNPYDSIVRQKFGTAGQYATLSQASRQLKTPTDSDLLELIKEKAESPYSTYIRELGLPGGKTLLQKSNIRDKAQELDYKLDELRSTRKFSQFLPPTSLLKKQPESVTGAASLLNELGESGLLKKYMRGGYRNAYTQALSSLQYKTEYGAGFKETPNLQRYKEYSVRDLATKIGVQRDEIIKKIKDDRESAKFVANQPVLATRFREFKALSAANETLRKGLTQKPPDAYPGVSDPLTKSLINLYIPNRVESRINRITSSFRGAGEEPLVFRGSSPEELSILRELGSFTSRGINNDSRQLGTTLSPVFGQALTSALLNKGGLISAYSGSALRRRGQTESDRNALRVQDLRLKELQSIINPRTGRFVDIEKLPAPSEFNLETTRELLRKQNLLEEKANFAGKDAGILNLFRKVETGGRSLTGIDYLRPATPIANPTAFLKQNLGEFLTYLQNSVTSTKPGAAPFALQSGTYTGLFGTNVVDRKTSKLLERVNIPNSIQTLFINRKLPTSEVYDLERLKDLFTGSSQRKSAAFKKGFFTDLQYALPSYNSGEREFTYSSTSPRPTSNFGSIFGFKPNSYEKPENILNSILGENASSGFLPNFASPYSISGKTLDVDLIRGKGTFPKLLTEIRQLAKSGKINRVNAGEIINGKISKLIAENGPALVKRLGIEEMTGSLMMGDYNFAPGVNLSSHDQWDEISRVFSIRNTPNFAQFGDILSIFGGAKTPENEGFANILSKSTRGFAVRNAIARMHPELGGEVLSGDLKRILTKLPPSSLQSLVGSGLIRNVLPEQIEDIGGAARGLIPSFAGLSDAINREKRAVGGNRVYIDQDLRLRNPDNPMGLLVANGRDEPGGGSQGVDRAIREGRNPKTYGIPNFADHLAGVRANQVEGYLQALKGASGPERQGIRQILSAFRDRIISEYGHEADASVTAQLNNPKIPTERLGKILLQGIKEYEHPIRAEGPIGGPFIKPTESPLPSVSVPTRSNVGSRQGATIAGNSGVTAADLVRFGFPPDQAASLLGQQKGTSPIDIQRQQIESARAEQIKIASFFRQEQARRVFAFGTEGRAQKSFGTFNERAGGYAGLSEEGNTLFENQRAGLRSIRGQRLQQAAFLGSFITPLVAETAARSLGVEENSRAGRTISGVTQGISSGVAIGSIAGGPIGAAVGGAWAGFVALNAITGNLTRSFDELVKQSSEVNGRRREEVNSLNQAVSAYHTLLDSATGGKAVQGRAQEQLQATLASIPEKFRGRLSTAIAERNTEGVQQIQFEAQAEQNRRERLSEATLKTIQVGDRQNLGDGVFSNLGGTNRRNILRAYNLPDDATTGERFSAALTRGRYELFNAPSGRNLNLTDVQKSFAGVRSAEDITTVAKEFASVPLKNLDKIDLSKQTYLNNSPASTILAKILKSGGADKDEIASATSALGNLGDEGTQRQAVIQYVQNLRKLQDKFNISKQALNAQDQIEKFVDISQDILKNVAYSFDIKNLRESGARTLSITRAEGLLNIAQPGLSPELTERFRYVNSTQAEESKHITNVNDIIGKGIGSLDLPQTVLNDNTFRGKLIENIKELSQRPENYGQVFRNISDITGQEDLKGGTKEGNKFEDKVNEIARKVGEENEKHINGQREVYQQHVLNLQRITREQAGRFLGGDVTRLRDFDTTIEGEGFGALGEQARRRLPRGRRGQEISADQGIDIFGLGRQLEDNQQLDATGRQAFAKAALPGVTAAFKERITDQIDSAREAGAPREIIETLTRSLGRVDESARVQVENALHTGSGAEIDNQQRYSKQLEEAHAKGLDPIEAQTKATLDNITSLDNLNKSIQGLQKSVEDVNPKKDATKPSLPAEEGNQAKGWIPNFNAFLKEAEDIRKGIGGARLGDTPYLAQIAGLGSTVVNTGESIIRNWMGSGKDAVLNRSMQASLGIIPNFAIEDLSEKSAEEILKITNQRLNPAPVKAAKYIPFKSSESFLTRFFRNASPFAKAIPAGLAPFAEYGASIEGGGLIGAAFQAEGQVLRASGEAEQTVINKYNAGIPLTQTEERTIARIRARTPQSTASPVRPYTPFYDFDKQTPYQASAQVSIPRLLNPNTISTELFGQDYIGEALQHARVARLDKRAQRIGLRDNAQYNRWLAGADLGEDAIAHGRIGAGAHAANVTELFRAEKEGRIGANATRANQAALFAAILRGEIGDGAGARNQVDLDEAISSGHIQLSYGFIPNFVSSSDLYYDPGTFAQNISRHGGINWNHINKIRRRLSSLIGSYGGSSGFSDELFDDVLGRRHKRYRRFRGINPLKVSGLPTHLSEGLIPAFHREKEALINRGISSSIAESLIFAGSRPEIGGMGIGNYLDEPEGRISPDLGILQGITRVVREGGNPRTAGAASGYIPNYATVNHEELVTALKTLTTTLGEQKEATKNTIQGPNGGVDVNHAINASVNVNVGGKVNSVNENVQAVVNQAMAGLKSEIESKLSQLQSTGRYTKTPPTIPQISNSPFIPAQKV